MLCEDNPSKLLGLEDVIVKKVWDDGEKHIEIELPPEDCTIIRKKDQFSQLQNSGAARVLQILRRAGVHEAHRAEADEDGRGGQRAVYGSGAAPSAEKACVQSLGGVAHMGVHQLSACYGKQDRNDRADEGRRYKF